MDEKTERLLEHSWRHFALHSQQRTTVFNFFTASAALTISGLFYVLATPTAPRAFGVVAGLGAAVLSLVFWKLDQRVTQIIKEGEHASIAIESELAEIYRQFARVERLEVNRSLSPFSGTWSYGRSFRLMFLVVALTGLIGAGFSMHLATVGAGSASDSNKRPANTISKPAEDGSSPPSLRSEKIYLSPSLRGDERDGVAPRTKLNTQVRPAASNHRDDCRHQMQQKPPA